MSFLVNPAFLTALAAWICALVAHTGLDVPAELVYGAASLVSVAVGGIAINKRRKNGKNGTGTGGSRIAVMVLGSMLILGTAAGCKSPVLGAGGEGRIYAAYENDTKLWLAYAEGGVHARLVIVGSNLYIAATGSGRIVAVRKDKRTGVWTTYLDQAITVNTGWMVVITMQGVPAPIVIPYEDAVKHTGVPGMPAELEDVVNPVIPPTTEADVVVVEDDS